MAAISSLLRIRPTPVMPSDCAICWSSGISIEARPVPARRRFLVSGSSSEAEAASLIRSDVVPVVSLNGFLPWRNFELDSRSFRVFQIAAMPMFWSASRHRFGRFRPCCGLGGWKTTVDTGCNTPGLSAEQTVLIVVNSLWACDWTACVE
ncbi:hypothetical protein J5V16_06800 [Glycomyces sp. NEAU-S30]|uniref:Uncharacterized protein n=1 Tax=Glycomyces niveus TaxID=2820287 RepID=A0ABS3U2P6_9ACTN|nr:hypothetical protein [Glycomyces sp. NEAU-S30]MBO3732526.1 hypothetical protein [Glycomyces sp. NEAU-S30]